MGIRIESTNIQRTAVKIKPWSINTIYHPNECTHGSSGDATAHVVGLIIIVRALISLAEYHDIKPLQIQLIELQVMR